ncbi:hypothetical protein LPJ66_007880 [Kickxella alabastrina]|uniref:Uncharacterized protein n=1 Tax=Kickxella alabastrina TaxID=61397 RepID=A0ACC1IBE7_9FUNG|nr:hypothetical protein LPJ66_007880 [Kickxella alabastrina]
MYEYAVLTGRDWLNLTRNISFLASQAMQSLAAALLVGFMFFYLKYDSISAQNRLGVLYIIALNATFPTIMPALYAFFDERDIMLRERSSGVYRITTFYVSKATTFTPIALISSIIFIMGVYFISRLTFDVSKIFITLGVLASLNTVSIAFMLMIGSAVKTMNIAFVVTPGIVIVELLFGGLLANPTSIPPAINWLRWINPVYYAYAAFIQNESRGLVFDCSPFSKCYQNGEEVIAEYGIEYGDDHTAKSSISTIDLDEPSASQTDVILSWKNLEYKVNSKDGPKSSVKSILRGISGQAKSGEAIALIGSSGAGKTTLLNALSGRIVGGELTGKILFRGNKRNPDTFKRLTAYVQQDDLMHPLLSVHETLSYASKLRLPNTNYTPEQKAERVNIVIQQLRLENARNTRIGDATTRGVSGGERKRVSIGTELLTDPRLLFLDEPTSGLDSNSSELVVELVKKISVEQGIASIMTIHQPSARIFNIFDKVILMSQGSIVYFGPTSSAIDYFASIGFQCPMHENPADYFVDLMTLDYRSDEALGRSKEQVDIMVKKFSVHLKQLAVKDSSQAKNFWNGHLKIDSNLLTEEVDTTQNGWFYEFRALYRRDWTNIVRNTYYIIGQVIQPMCMGMFIGFLFYYLGHDSVSILNRLGILYIIVVQATFPIFMPQIALLVTDLVIAAREQASASYRLSTYYVSKAATYAPIALICNTLFYASVYFISRLDFNAGKFFTGLIIFYCQNIVTIGFMFVFAGSIKSVAVIYLISTAAITVQMLYSGLFVNFKSITVALSWIRWVNPIFYAFSALAQNEMTGMAFTCTDGLQCFESGDQALSSYDMNVINIWQNVLLLLLVGAGYYIGGYILLMWKVTPRYIWL